MLKTHSRRVVELNFSDPVIGISAEILNLENGKIFDIFPKKCVSIWRAKLYYRLHASRWRRSCISVWI